MLFNLGLDPFLHAFERALDFGSKGIVRACADDVAFALSRLAHLNLLRPIYSKAERIAGLYLKHKKCNIVPCIEITPDILNKVSRWIRRNIPAWSDFSVVEAPEFLGFFLWDPEWRTTSG